MEGPTPRLCPRVPTHRAPARSILPPSSPSGVPISGLRPDSSSPLPLSPGGSKVFSGEQVPGWNQLGEPLPGVGCSAGWPYPQAWAPPARPRGLQVLWAQRCSHRRQYHVSLVLLLNLSQNHLDTGAKVQQH